MKARSLTVLGMIAALAIGLAAGFFGRPLVSGRAGDDSPSVDMNASDADNALTAQPLPNAPPMPVPSSDPRELARLKEQATTLGAAAMRKMAMRFVAVQVGDTGIGPTFFDTPRPFPDGMCRVNAYHLANRVIAGTSRSSDDNESWKDDFELTPMYAIWMSPIGPQPSDAIAERVCADYRDFDHLFITDAMDVGQAPAELAILIEAARAGGPMPASVKCVRTDLAAAVQSQPCDPKAILRRFKLQDLAQVQEQDDGRPNYDVTTDTLIFRTGRKEDTVGITIKARRLTKRMSDLIEVDIGIEAPCH